MVQQWKRGNVLYCFYCRGVSSGREIMFLLQRVSSGRVNVFDCFDCREVSSGRVNVFDCFDCREVSSGRVNVFVER